MSDEHILNRLVQAGILSLLMSSVAVTRPLMAQSSTASTLSPGVTAASGRTLAPKAPGVTRIGVLTPVVEFQGSPDAQMLGAQLLTIVVSYLQAPTLEVVPLVARVSAAAALEAKTSECDDVLTVHLTRTSEKSKGGMFGMTKHLPIGMLPGIGMVGGSTAAVVATQAATVAATAAASLAASTQPKDTITFEYSLATVPVGAIVVKNKSSAQAKQSGEDLITPLVSSMANAIVPQLLAEKQ